MLCRTTFLLRRLDDASNVGIAFRIPQDSTSHFFAVTVSSEIGNNEQPRVNLFQVKNNKDVTTIATKPIPFVGSGRINLLSVTDNGADNTISGTLLELSVSRDDQNSHVLPFIVELNGRPVFTESINAQRMSFARAGLFVVSGTAAVSDIAFTAL